MLELRRASSHDLLLFMTLGQGHGQAVPLVSTALAASHVLLRSEAEALVASINQAVKGRLVLNRLGKFAAAT